jgi:Zn-finger nucleic acid-binding protein
MLLQRDPATQLEIDVCLRCRGMWFDASEIGEFLKSPALKSRFLVPADPSRSQVERDEELHNQRRCPRCKRVMVNKFYSGVTFDYCEECDGIWCDAGELTLAVERFQKGARSGDAFLDSEIKAGLSASEAGKLVMGARWLFNRLGKPEGGPAVGEPRL